MLFITVGAGYNEPTRFKNKAEIIPYDLLDKLLSDCIKGWRHPDFDLIEVYYNCDRITLKNFNPIYRKKRRYFYEDLGKELLILPITIPMELNLLIYGDRNDLQFLQDLFTVSTLDSIIHVGKRYKLPIEELENERNKYVGYDERIVDLRVMLAEDKRYRLYELETRCRMYSDWPEKLAEFKVLRTKCMQEIEAEKEKYDQKNYK